MLHGDMRLHTRRPAGTMHAGRLQRWRPARGHIICVPVMQAEQNACDIAADMLESMVGGCLQVLTEQVGRLVDGIVDGRQLCIDAGRAAWLAYLDIYVLDAGAENIRRSRSWTQGLGTTSPVLSKRMEWQGPAADASACKWDSACQTIKWTVSPAVGVGADCSLEPMPERQCCCARRVAVGRHAAGRGRGAVQPAAAGRPRQ